MKKYNTRKRATYNQASTQKTHTLNATHNTQKTRKTHKDIHISIRYDGYARTKYDNGILHDRHTSKEQTYTNITNALNDTFPEINAPHNAHTHRAIAPYKRVILTEPDIPYTAPSDLQSDPTNIHTEYENTARKKCVIFNTHDEIIHMGVFTRTIHIDRYGKYHGTATITLYRNDRSIQVYPYIPRTNNIHGMTLKDIREHDVELYHI